jgi:hypothetical protein
MQTRIKDAKKKEQNRDRAKAAGKPAAGKPAVGKPAKSSSTTKRVKEIKWNSRAGGEER